jgi:hypothetical protein
MLEMRPNCECCDADLPAAQPGALVCSFECTFCAVCARKLGDRCPNCGGGLVSRPTRPAALLAKHPATTARKLRAAPCF